MTRGQVANRLNISTEAIRYYEKIGLIRPEFLENSYRYYSDLIIEKLELIIVFKNLGFTLKEIKDFFDLMNSSLENPNDLNRYLTRKIEQIDEKVESLNKLKKSLVLFKDKEDKDNCDKFSKFIQKS